MGPVNLPPQYCLDAINTLGKQPWANAHTHTHTHAQHMHVRAHTQSHARTYTLTQTHTGLHRLAALPTHTCARTHTYKHTRARTHTLTHKNTQTHKPSPSRCLAKQSLTSSSICFLPRDTDGTVRSQQPSDGMRDDWMNCFEKRR